MRVKVILCVCAFTLPLFLGAEPSIFGIPEKEKKEQEEYRKQIRKELHFLSTTIQQIKESQNGMQSLFDSQSKKLQELYTKNQRSPFVSQGEMQEAFKDLNTTLITNFRTYDESFESLKKGLESLGELIEALNTQQKKELEILFTHLDNLEERLLQEKQTYMKDLEAIRSDIQKIKNTQELNIANKQATDSKEPKDKAESTELIQRTVEYQTVVEVPVKKPPEKTVIASNENQSSNKQQEKNEPPKKENKTTVNLESLPNGVVHQEGLKLFKKGDLNEAKRYLERSVEKSYKPATSIFYLGEIAYKQKRFEDAIAYYKDSATRYDKASYMPTLLLHTAMSFKALNDKANAKNFLEILISSYPSSKEAKEAKGALKKL